MENEYNNDDMAREGLGAESASPLESEPSSEPHRVLGSERLGRFFDTGVMKDSWLNWGLVLLIGVALFAIYKIMAVILMFVG